MIDLMSGFFYEQKRRENMNITKSVKNGLYSLGLSLKRYPSAIVFSTLTTVIIIVLIYHGNSYNEEVLQKIAMVTALGFPFFLCIKSIFERKTNISITTKIITYIFSLILVFSYIFLLKELNMVSITRYIAVSLSLYLLFILIPYFFKRENFELYVVKIFSRFIISFIYSTVLFTGLSITLFTIEHLLNLPISEELYISTWFIVAGIFAPIFLLGGIPEYNETVTVKDYPRILEILLIYIVMPLISIYTFILYLYFGKMLIIRQWPQGLLAHLVLWYAIITISVLFIVSPLKKKNNWIRFFVKWMPTALIPPLLMMFAAIGIRIKTYGVTENRYFVILMGLWIIGIVIYYILSKKKYNIILPLSLAALSFLAVFGPWSSYSLSIISQNKRFVEIVQKYDMIRNNTIIESKIKISEDDQKELEGILRYFEYSHHLNDLKYLPDNFTVNDVKKYFGFSYYSSYRNQDLQYFYYYFKDTNKIIIKSYDYLFYLSSNNNELLDTENNLKVKLNNLSIDLQILQDEKVIYHKSLLPILVELHKENKELKYEDYYEKEFIYTDENNNTSLKIIFNSFSGYYEKGNPDALNIDHITFHVLFKVK